MISKSRLAKSKSIMWLIGVHGGLTDNKCVCHIWRLLTISSIDLSKMMNSRTYRTILSICNYLMSKQLCVRNNGTRSKHHERVVTRLLT